MATALFVAWSKNEAYRQKLEMYGASGSAYAVDRLELTQLGSNPNPDRNWHSCAKIFRIDNHSRYLLEATTFYRGTFITARNRFDLKYPEYGIVYPEGPNLVVQSTDVNGSDRLTINLPPGQLDYWTPGSTTRNIDDEPFLFIFFDMHDAPIESGKSFIWQTYEDAEEFCRKHNLSMIALRLIRK